MFKWLRQKMEPKPKCIMCLSEDKSVSKCPKCGQYFCKDHFKHACNEEKIKEISSLYEEHWHRGRIEKTELITSPVDRPSTTTDSRYQHWARTKPKTKEGQIWDEFTQSYRDVMFGAKTEERITVHRCAICNSTTNTRICKICGHYYCLEHILPEDHNCGKINF